MSIMRPGISNGIDSNKKMLTFKYRIQQCLLTNLNSVLHRIKNKSEYTVKGTETPQSIKNVDDNLDL